MLCLKQITSLGISYCHHHHNHLHVQFTISWAPFPRVLILWRIFWLGKRGRSIYTKLPKVRSWIRGPMFRPRSTQQPKNVGTQCLMSWEVNSDSVGFFYIEGIQFNVWLAPSLQVCECLYEEESEWSHSRDWFGSVDLTEHIQLVSVLGQVLPWSLISPAGSREPTCYRASRWISLDFALSDLCCWSQELQGWALSVFLGKP